MRRGLLSNAMENKGDEERVAQIVVGFAFW